MAGRAPLSRPAAVDAADRRRDGPEIGELAEERLRSNAYLALKNISCEYREGVLTLRGCLPTYYLRQIAQTAVAGMDGVRAVVDRIEVVPAATRCRTERRTFETLRNPGDNR